jgi:large subunit ribosomal protein L23
MTKNDIKQYLEKIYKIDVLDVTTIIKQGKENRHPVSSEIIDPDPDRKFAYVFLVNM